MGLFDNDIEREEGKELLDSKRHDDLVSGNKNLIKAIDKFTKVIIEKKDENLTVLLGRFIEKLDEEKTINIPEPKVSVQVNNDVVVQSVNQLGRDLLVELKKYNEPKQKAEWTFIVERDRGGYIDKVIAKQIK